MANVITRNQNGDWEATEPFVVTCGCGGIVPDARNKLRMAGVPEVPMLVSSDNLAVKGYIKQIGLADRVPSLNKGKHSVLFNPKNGLFVDLHRAGLSQELYDNIYSVVNS